MDPRAEVPDPAFSLGFMLRVLLRMVVILLIL